MQEHPASVAVGTHPKVCLLAHPTARPVPVRGLQRRSSALGGPLEGWLVASKRLGPLPRMTWAALGRGCGGEGSGALPLPRAAAVGRRVNRLEGTPALGREGACLVGAAPGPTAVLRRAPPR